MSAIIRTEEEIARDDKYAMLHPGTFDCTQDWYNGLITAIPDGMFSAVLTADAYLAKYLGMVLRPIEKIIKQAGIHDISTAWLNTEIRKDYLLKARITPNCSTGDLATFIYYAAEISVPVFLIIWFIYLVFLKKDKHV
ncbi:TPA: hypothetical protein H2A59_004590 [Salmonella enterica]|nr:hypothetical protein [Salmonella enterica]